MTDLRAIEALVAEHVLGLVVETITIPGGLQLKFIKDEGGHSHGLPHYTTDIAAAWQVVEEMDKRGITTRIVYNIYGRLVYFVDRSTLVKTDGEWHEPVVGESQNHSVPLAICLAALMAVGVKVEVRRDVESA